MDCPHRTQDTLDDGTTRVCVDCGAVLDDCVLSAVVHTEPASPLPPPLGPRPWIAARMHQRSYSEQAKDRLGRLLSEMSRHFGYTVDNQQIMARFDTLLQYGLCDHGKSGERAIAALFLLLGRRGGLPISLHRVAEYLDDRGIGRMVLGILERCPELAAPSQPDRFLARHLSLIAPPPEAARKANQSFASLCGYLTACGFHEGRSPEPFSLAVLLVVVEACGVSVDAVQLCDALHLPHRTVYTRYAEIKKHLLAQARALLPWGSRVKKSTVLEYLDDLMPLLEAQCAPPAFLRSAGKLREREELISQVQHGQPASTLDAFIVEYLLEAGWSEAEICGLPRLTLDQLDQAR